MPFVLSVSGSTILSETSRLHELFQWGCGALEIGSFADSQAYAYVLQQCRARSMKLAIHSPFYRDGNRYGLLANEASAWTELERDLSLAQQDGLSYLLVHFPYLRQPVEGDLPELIQQVAQRLGALSRSYGVPLLAEPKLGPDCDPAMLCLMHTLSQEQLAAWGLPFCLDVGDIYLAAERSKTPYLDMVSHLAPLAAAVHLHDVVILEDGRYIWAPASGEDAVPIRETLALLAADREIFLVVEHTPHLVASEEQVQRCIDWLHGLCAGSR